MISYKYLLFFVVTTATAFFVAKSLYLDIANDPEQPQFITITDFEYQLYGNRVLTSFTLTVHEEINEGTNVSASLQNKK